MKQLHNNETIGDITMNYIMPSKISEEIERKGIIAVLEIEDENTAIPVVQALIEGGVTAIELALRTPAAEPAISLIAGKFSEMMIGIGTIIESGQAERIKKYPGVSFGVAPGTNPAIIKEAQQCGLPFAPGIATPTEIELALSLGCRILKFFPAEGMGGLSFLKSIDAPFRHLDLHYIPLGGISQENLAAYAKMEQILAIGGSWIANKELIRTGNWKEINRRAKAAQQTWKNIRGS
ncbi:bifunctional 4-hydroxy-2-oxoglutarate aldolase/2-dehydro-3-deoxy-phosphogluconate aldolase [Treponema sp. TIM-1]|uniref:bifunctional 4-hydroxy-2-oxoglutarate aldolase/2-dehydro-3-deoxy-phosphogluconate aldolase n=1 Tax=Treponema sp. TIM-1 TaxID=2898417 RepID=UPI00397F0EDD